MNTELTTNALAEKVKLGQFYTTQNIFNYPHFQEWFIQALKESNNLVLEPFAGSNNLIKMLQEEGYNFDFVAYDINPGSFEVEKRDTIQYFPHGYRLIITNPPYLAKNSACRKKIPFPTTGHDDLYKLCLEVMLKNCDYVGAIIPASFINADLFLDRLHSYTLLSSQMFTDTENPVCLALFSPQPSNSVWLYENDKYVGELYSLKKELAKVLTNFSLKNCEIKFNDKNGNIGLCAIDNTQAPSIAFIDAQLVPKRKIKVSSRHLTRISVKEMCPLQEDNIAIGKKVDLGLLNEKLAQIREFTQDFFLTPFRGLRKDGKFRRRLDFQLARKIITSSLLGEKHNDNDKLKRQVPGTN